MYMFTYAVMSGIIKGERAKSMVFDKRKRNETGSYRPRTTPVCRAAITGAVILLFVLATGGISLAEITGPTVIPEDVPSTWTTTKKPFGGILGYKNILYTWRFGGPGGTMQVTGASPTSLPHAWDTPSDPELNSIVVLCTYTTVNPNPEPPPLTIETPGIPRKDVLMVLVTDTTAPGEDGTTFVQGLPSALSGVSGEDIEQDIVVRVKDNNPNIGPDPADAAVELYYQVGPHERHTTENESGDLEEDHRAGPFPCNDTYSHRPGDPERMYSNLNGSYPEAEVEIETRDDSGWPDEGYWWVGPLIFDNQGVVEEGDKFNITQWYLPREKIILPMHFATTSSDWQPLKAFLKVTDASGQVQGKHYIHAQDAHSDSTLTTSMTVTDDKFPWMTVKVEDFRSHWKREFSLYMSTWNIFYNMDDTWKAEDDYRWPPPDGRNSFLVPPGSFFQEDVRMLFHVFACDNIDMVDPDILYNDSDLDHTDGLDVDSLFFQVFRLPETGDAIVELEVAGQNDFLVEKVFPVAADYVIKFQAADYAGNERIMFIDLPLTDTVLKHTQLENRSFDH